MFPSMNEYPTWFDQKPSHSLPPKSVIDARSAADEAWKEQLRLSDMLEDGLIPYEPQVREATEKANALESEALRLSRLWHTNQLSE